MTSESQTALWLTFEPVVQKVVLLQYDAHGHTEPVSTSGTHPLWASLVSMAGHERVIAMSHALSFHACQLAVHTNLRRAVPLFKLEVKSLDLTLTA